MTVISNFISILATVLFFAILIRAIMSWIMPNSGGGLMRVLLDITEPILAPIRRVLPPIAGIDFSPILAMVLIQLVSQVLQQLLNSA
jgi:YggT family protein